MNFHENSSMNLQKSENVFLRKLDKLLDYCVYNPQEVDEGTILGILIAKGQERFFKDNENVAVLMQKIEVTERNFEEMSEEKVKGRIKFTVHC